MKAFVYLTSLIAIVIFSEVTSKLLPPPIEDPASLEGDDLPLDFEGDFEDMPMKEDERRVTDIPPFDPESEYSMDLIDDHDDSHMEEGGNVSKNL